MLAAATGFLLHLRNEAIARRRKMWPVIGMAVSMVAFLGCGAWYHLENDLTAPKMPDITLRSVFDSDFSQFMKRESDLKFGISQDGSAVLIHSALILDFAGPKKYLAFFIPDSPRVFDLCMQLARTYRSQLSDNGLEIVSGSAAGPAQTSLPELSFSGQIYLYTERDMTPEQLAEVEKAFQQEGATVTVRGTAYWLPRSQRQH